MVIREYEYRNEMYLDVPKGGVGAEIGVAKATNAIPLYHITKPSKMHLVDIWHEAEEYWQDGPLEGTPRRYHNMTTLWYDDHEKLVGDFFKEEVKNGKVVTHKKYGGDFLNSLDDDELDWVYLDADHNYVPVNIELDLCLRKVKKGGLIMGHDFCTEATVWRSGVIRAVQEKIQAGKMMMVGITIESWPSWMCIRT